MDKHSGSKQLGTKTGVWSFFGGAFLNLYPNLLALERMSLLLLQFVFGQPPRKGEKVSVPEDKKKRESIQMTFKCTGEEDRDSQRLSGRSSTVEISYY